MKDFFSYQNGSTIFQMPKPEVYKEFFNKYMIISLPMYYDRLQRFIDNLEYKTRGKFNCFFYFSNRATKIFLYTIYFKMGPRRIQKGFTEVVENFYFIGKRWSNYTFTGPGISIRMQELSIKETINTAPCYFSASFNVPLCLFSQESDLKYVSDVKDFLKTIRGKLENKSKDEKLIQQKIESEETDKKRATKSTKNPTVSGLKRKRS